MNRINKLFKEKPKDILSIYFTAGFPKVDKTLEIAKFVEASGADLIEIGIPFSDPVADGPTIQASNKKALDNGMTLNLLFSQLEKLRETISIPIILMGYINPVMQYGLDAFCAKCRACGVDGVILPDLPIDVYTNEFKGIFDKYDLKNTFLITPQTPEERVRQIDSITDGFIYMVSSTSTTGTKNSFDEEQESYFKRIKNMNLKNPTLIGFGISNSKTFKMASQYSRGAIIGSAFINVLKDADDMKMNIRKFIKEVKEG